MRNFQFPEFHRVASSDELRPHMNFVVFDKHNIKAAAGHALAIAPINQFFSPEDLKKMFDYTEEFFISKQAYKDYFLKAERVTFDIVDSIPTFTIKAKNKTTLIYRYFQDDNDRKFPDVYAVINPINPSTRVKSERFAANTNLYLQALTILKKCKSEGFDCFAHKGKNVFISQECEYKKTPLLMVITMNAFLESDRFSESTFHALKI